MTADAPTRHYATLRVPAHHPALAGHFPGNPVVPGVVILDAVIAAAEGSLGRRLSVLGMSHAKFLMPLRPDEAAGIEITISGPVLEFAVRRDETTIAKGRLDIAQGPAT